MVTLEDSEATVRHGTGDGRLFQLAARVAVVEQMLDKATTALAQADRWLSQLSKAKSGAIGHARPACLLAARHGEAAASDASDLIYRQIVLMPAVTKAGLAIKLQLIAQLHGASRDACDKNASLDLVADLLQSLIVDVTAR